MRRLFPNLAAGGTNFLFLGGKIMEHEQYLLNPSSRHYWSLEETEESSTSDSLGELTSRDVIDLAEVIEV